MRLHEALEKAHKADNDQGCVYLPDEGIELMYHGPNIYLTNMHEGGRFTPTYNQLVSDKWEICT